MIYSVVDEAFVGDSVTDRVTVLNQNRGPVFDPVASQTVLEGNVVSMVVTARDPDGDAITELTAEGAPFTLATTDAAFVVIPETNGSQGRLTWKPTCRNGGAGSVDYPVTFRARAQGGSAITLATISVQNADCAPIIRVSVTPAGESTTETGLITMEVEAEDPDGVGLISFQALGVPLTIVNEGQGHRPASFQYAAANAGGTFAWSPGCADTGRYYVYFTARDAGGNLGSADKGFDVTPVHCPLQLAGPPASVIATEAQPTSFSIGAYSPEGGTPAFAWAPRPAGATLTTSAAGYGRVNAAFAWSPSCTQAGNHSPIFTVTATGADGVLDTVSVSTNFTVAADNGANCRAALSTLAPWTTPLDGDRVLTLSGARFYPGSSLLVDGVDRSSFVVAMTETEVRFRAPPRLSDDAPSVALVTVDNHESSLGPPVGLRLHYFVLTPIGGVDWGRVRAIAASNLSAQLFAALQSGNFYVTTNAGASWRQTGPQTAPGPTSPGVPPEFLVFDAVSDRNLFFAGGTSGFQVDASTDLGRKWEALASALPPAITCTDNPPAAPRAPYAGLAPAKGGGVYVLSNVNACGGGVWRSPFGAAGWTWLKGTSTSTLPDPNPQAPLLYHALASASTNRDVMMVATSLGTYVSFTAGRLWGKTATDPSGLVRKLVFDPRDANHLFALTNSGVHESTNLGAAWTSRPALALVQGDLAVARATGAPKATVYAVSPSKLFASPDNGESAVELAPAAIFTKVVAATQAAAASSMAIAGFTAPVVPSYAQKPLDNAALRTTDSGASWIDGSQNLSGSSIDRLVVTRAGGIAVLSGQRIYSRAPSSPRGRLAPSITGVPSPILDIAASESASDNVFAVVNAFTRWIYRSTDTGLNFEDKSPPVGANNRYGMTVATTPGMVHVLTENYFTGNPSIKWMMRSTNEGDSWTEFASNPLPCPQCEGAIMAPTGARFLVDYRDPSYLWYLQPFNAGYGSSYRRSTNYGRDWIHDSGPFDPSEGMLFLDRHSPNLGPTDRLVFVPGGLNAKVARNEVGGFTGYWTQQDIPWRPVAGPRIRGLGQLRPPKQDVFLAGSADGLLMSSDRGVSWKKLYVHGAPVLQPGELHRARPHPPQRDPPRHPRRPPRRGQRLLRRCVRGWAVRAGDHPAVMGSSP